MVQDLASDQVFAPTTPEPTLAPPAQTLTVTASPMTISAFRRQAVSIAGTLTALSYTRGSWTGTVSVGTSIVEMDPGDKITITYLVAPTITIIPR